ncbi:cytochrome c oxidase subunit II [Haloferax sulfurifontis]|uniref:cytochrome-c oxidase n=2 Tax=Haloferax sulfurifontis TaxID=255616 RepID=M0ICK1_9EURY|nr:cytochrome c oxidase subunit II [Haloferax sulfurifontis]ELZ93573.1 cytochrome c oxidase subunit II [Haloferax sulfurifontis ATCC BAA-897]GGC60674.1 cytochrome c oxidase subunit II [Haloferax sulfurifontis]
MRKTRFALASLLATAVMALVATPAAAQASATSELINQLNGELLYVAIPITVLVEVILLYTVIKFRNSERALPTKENRRLEITWTIATAIILLFVGVASYGVLANENVTHQGNDIAMDDDPVVVTAEAYQWGWNMYYPEEGNFSSGNEIVIPADRPVYFQITSADVIHGFHVPELALKQDAMPGSTNTIKTVAYEEGTYQGYCTEYCGVAHSQMYFTVEVVSQDEYQNWLDEQQSANSESSSSSSNSTATNSTQ